jgi:Sulfotransferase family
MEMTAAVMTGAIKRLGGLCLGIAPQCSFERCVFIIGHMRCGSTVLSNILCARREISGFGESHVAYRSRHAPGLLALSQIRHRRWKPKARFLFDKILHNRLDECRHPDFFGARAIFVARSPDATIPSILRLFRGIGSSEYPDAASAAEYYRRRLVRMRDLWAGFPADRRIALRYEDLVEAPEAELGRLTAFLQVSPPLANAYPPVASARHGAGDPHAHRFTTIVPGGIRHAAAHRPATPDCAEMFAAGQAHAEFCATALPNGPAR